MRVFIDSDVVVSAVISDKGAAAMLLNGQRGVKMAVSDVSRKESLEVVKRLGLDRGKLGRVLSGVETIKLDRKGNHGMYVRDLGDAHIVAGASQSKSGFLLTYNQKHYDVEKIKRGLGILVMSPGMFLQYLRSLESNN